MRRDGASEHLDAFRHVCDDNRQNSLHGDLCTPTELRWHDIVGPELGRMLAADVAASSNSTTRRFMKTLIWSPSICEVTVKPRWASWKARMAGRM